jgi:dual specificity tyrosine-phosphorylation-regulated kinase 2/3/4
MLGIPYDCGIDMWSFGCIMAELYMGYPIFPGDSEQDQMSRIMEMIGVPSREVMAQSERKMRFFKQNESGYLEPFMSKNSRGRTRKPLGKPLPLVIGE